MMSKQWGNGYHTGNKEGIDIGVPRGEQIGGFLVGENVWYCVNAAIAAIVNGNELQALAILRALLYLLAPSTGIYPINPINHLNEDKKV